MKYTRIFLFLSPLVLFLPPLLPLQKNVAWGMLGLFYGRILRLFPWNIVLAYLCYTYAQQLGRDEFRWAGASFFFPFFAPVILGFMPPKDNSTADVVRRMTAPPPRVKGAAGPFVERFPLLQRCLSGMPETVCAEQQARFTPIESNYEFSLPVNPAALDRLLAEAATRQFTLWTVPGDAETQVYGAGLVQPAATDDVAKWLRGACVSGGKLNIVWLRPDGLPQRFEYYAA